MSCFSHCRMNWLHIIFYKTSYIIILHKSLLKGNILIEKWCNIGNFYTSALCFLLWKLKMKSCTCLMSLSSSNSMADLMRCIPDQPELSYLTLKHKHMDVWETWASTLENKVSKFFSLISLISSIWNAEMKSCICLMSLSSSNSLQTWWDAFLISLNRPTWDTNINAWMSELPEHEL